MRFRSNTIIVIVVILVGLVGINSWLNKPESSYDKYMAETAPAAPDDLFLGEQILPPVPGPEFELIDYTGETVSLSDYKGKVVLLTFAYTSCPDVCPIMFGRFLEIQKELGEAIGTEVELVFISVDPEVDTPERLAAHVKAMGGSWHFLTGELEAMQKVWDAFNLWVEKEDPIVNHTNLAFLIDENGLVRIQYTGLPPVSAFLSDIYKILQGG